MNEEYKNWLLSLNAGDELAIEEWSRLYGKIYTLTKIKKITPNRWIKTERYPDRAFRDGERHSFGAYTSSSMKLVPLTPEIRDEANYRNALSHIANLKFTELPKEKVMKIYELVK